MNELRSAIEFALKDIHIETGRNSEFIKVVNKIEIEVSKKVTSQDINPYDEMNKDFTNYEVFED